MKVASTCSFQQQTVIDTLLLCTAEYLDGDGDVLLGDGDVLLGDGDVLLGAVDGQYRNSEGTWRVILN